MAATFGAEVQRWQETNDPATTVITLTGAIAIGKTIVLPIQWVSATETLTGVVDSKGNTYTIHKNYTLPDATTHHIAIVAAYATTALAINDTITITWGSPVYSYRWGAVFYINDAASLGQPDQTATGSHAYGTAISISAATTVAGTALLGIVFCITDGITYGSSAWNVSGTTHGYGSKEVFYVYYDAASSGTQNPGGTLSANDTWGGIWVALSPMAAGGSILPLVAFGTLGGNCNPMMG